MKGISLEEVVVMIEDAFEHPEKIGGFGQSKMPEIEKFSVDPNATEYFFACRKTYLNNLLASHPWQRTIFGSPSTKIHGVSKVQYWLVRGLFKMRADTGLIAHYRHIEANQDLEASKNRLVGAAEKLHEVYQKLNDGIEESGDALNRFRDFIQKAEHLFSEDPRIAQIKKENPESTERMATRLSALSSRAILASQQIVQMESAKDPVLRNLDEYGRLMDVFLPAYEHQQDLLAEASPYELYKYYQQFHSSMSAQFGRTIRNS